MIEHFLRRVSLIAFVALTLIGPARAVDLGQAYPKSEKSESKNAGNEEAPKPPTIVAPEVIGTVKARPRVMGDMIADAEVLSNFDGKNYQLKSVLEGKMSVVVYTRSETIFGVRATGYFRTLVPYLSDLGYQIVFVSTSPEAYLKDIATATKRRFLLSDIHHKAHIAMGLMDKDDAHAPSISAIYLVDPSAKILFSFASVSNDIPFSGEVLVLAARVYSDAYKKKAAAK